MPARRTIAFDSVIDDIARYVAGYRTFSPLARKTSQWCLLDSLGCAFEALTHPECTQLLGPLVPGSVVPNGVRVPGTSFVLDPVKGAFDISTVIRWLDYNDAFYGRTVIHPSDVLGALLAVADWHSRARIAAGKPPVTMAEVLDAAILAYEVMGWLALENAFMTRMGLDHVVLIKLGAAAVSVKLLGGSEAEIANAVSNAWVDGHALPTYRRKPNSGTRKNWAAGEAASRGVWLGLLALRGEMGYASALTAPTWGFYDVHNGGEPFRFQRPLGCYVMENVQFKISYPAGFHAQTAAEAAVRMHREVAHRIDDIARIDLWSHEYGLAILDRRGPLANAADRDHCLQYIVAIGLLHGRLEAGDYADAVAADPRIDRLRDLMHVHEDSAYTRAFTAPNERANANAIQVGFRDGSGTARLEVKYPVGHPRRRTEGLPLLHGKFADGVARIFAARQAAAIKELCMDSKRLRATPVNELFDLMTL